VPQSLLLAVLLLPLVIFLELVRFRGKTKIINLPQEISTNYLKVGILLLKDEAGARVKGIEHRYREDSEQIIPKILEQWINGNGKQPVTWEHSLKCYMM